MKVLLVEDSPTLQAIVSHCIKSAGHSLIIASNGETAVQLMELNGADLIICDIEMPGLNGLETVSIIREFLGEQWIPIIFVTRHDRTEDYLAGFDVGADDYLVKPLNEKILLAKMRVMERYILMQQQLNEARNAPEEASKFDKLTQVYSSDHFFDLALLHWSILSRQALTVTLLIIKIDHFDDYKNYYGDDQTRVCLKEVAKAISNTVHRPGDFVGRVTEDEFILMLPDTGKTGSEKVAGRICNAIESLNLEHKRSRVLGVVSVSVGVATTSSLRKYSLDNTVKKAFKVLQKAVTDGGNCFHHIKLGSMKVSGVDV